MLAIIDYRMGNIFSVFNALKRVCNAPPRILTVSEGSGGGEGAADMPSALASVTVSGEIHDFLEEVEGIVLPGVGAFDDGIRNLRPFRAALLKAISEGVPFLGICLGMQLLFEESEESMGRGGSSQRKNEVEKGLGIFRGKVVRLHADVRVPHIGWNRLRIQRHSSLLEGISEGDFFYFAHSFFCVPANDVVVATTEYGGEIPAVVSNDSETVFGVQFHPEKSSKKGLQIIKNFVKICKK